MPQHETNRNPDLDSSYREEPFEYSLRSQSVPENIGQEKENVRFKTGKTKTLMLAVPLVLAFALALTWVVLYVHFKVGNATNAQAFQKRFDALCDSKNVHEAVLNVENSAGDFSESYGYGGRDIDSPMVIASVTKLFTTACVLRLVEDGRLSLDDKIGLYIDGELLKGLHVYKNTEYSFDITVRDLLFQTSGLPDYFGHSDLVDDAIMNKDAYITFEQYVQETKQLSPRFAPNTGKAYYADINFDLLGKILEKITGLPLEDIYRQFVFAPLGMKNTYLPVRGNDFVPYVYYGSKKLERPLFIASCRASGGCVSTARDMMVFIKAFWSGKLFGKTIIESLANYKGLQLDMFPVEYGGGHMRVPLNGINTFFLAKGALVGHSGSTGAFAFRCPEKDLFFVGDLSQFENPGAPIKFAMALAMVAK